MKSFGKRLKSLVFGDRDINIKYELLRRYDFIHHSNIKIDAMSIIFFLGKWLPYSIAVGVATGVIASLMDLFVVKINTFLSRDIILFFIYPIIVAIIAGAAIKRLPETSGPGIGFSILHLLRSNSYLRVKAMIYKLFVSILALSGGFVAGREGPSFYLGIGLGEWIGRIYGFGKKYRNILGLIGGGAFTGALLKAPLGSSIFAMELEKTYDFDYRPFMPMIVASITSYLTFSFFRGNHAFIQLSDKPVWDMSSIPFIVIMGLVIAGVIYIYTLFFHFSVKASLLMPSGRRPVIGTLLGIPLMFGLYWIMQSTEILSAPANMHILTTMAEIQFPISVDVGVILMTILLTSLTLGFGIPGGLILPVLIIGTSVGNIFGHIFPDQLLMFTLAGMGSALSAAAKTPLAAIVMITEMSHDDVVIPMTAAVITSYIASFGYSLYLGQENVFKGNLRDFSSKQHTAQKDKGDS